MNTETKSTHCLNCGNTFTGGYCCPCCGQKADTRRLNFAEMVRNTISPFVGGEQSLPQEGHVPIANGTRPYRQRDTSLLPTRRVPVF